MLVELGLVEHPYRAVLEVLNGSNSVTDVARRNGVVQQTVHTWPTKYVSKGLAGLAEGSPRPDTCPHQMAPEVEAKIVEWRYPESTFLGAVAAESPATRVGFDKARCSCSTSHPLATVRAAERRLSGET